MIVTNASRHGGKGGAQVGIENLNIMAGFNPTDGLLDRGAHP